MHPPGSRNEPGRLDIHPPRPGISLHRTAVMEGTGRTGGISTYDLTRTRYLSPLSPRKERFRSFTAKRPFSLSPFSSSSSSSCSSFSFFFFVFLSFRRNLIAAAFKRNIRLDYLRSEFAAWKGYGENRTIFYVELRRAWLEFRRFSRTRLTRGADNSDKSGTARRLMISINAPASRYM